MNAPRTELIVAMRKRAEIRRGIPRAETDRIADQLEAGAKEIEQLDSELARLMAENELLKKDAVRYRWLRESCLDSKRRQISSVQMYGDEIAFEELDVAIDAAIKGEPK